VNFRLEGEHAYSSATPCGAAAITDDATCAAAAAALGHAYGSVPTPEGAAGCLLHEGYVYFSPRADGSASYGRRCRSDARAPRLLVHSWVAVQTTERSG
jgi:hypothetical protein